MYELLEENEFGKEVVLGEFESIDDATTHLRTLGFQDVTEEDWEAHDDDTYTQLQFSLLVI
jgi:hypothetical protein